ncbi:MAG: hypothetical protein GX562_06945, partial [Coriobacteriaceae bacterium]|nr:hypothetical protein [Coriobacteriaceae bacterium]
MNLAKYYAIEQDNQNQIINLIEDQQDPYAHARPMKLKYTDYGANQKLLMVTLLSQIEEMLTKILDEKEQQSQAIKDKDAIIA